MHTAVSRAAEAITARRTLDLLVQLAEATTDALSALERGELAALDEHVERRGGVLARCAPLMQELGLLHQRGEAVDVVAEVVRAGRAVQAQERRLLLELSRHQGAVADELRRMSSADAAHAAYTAPPPAFSPR